MVSDHCVPGVAAGAKAFALLSEEGIAKGVRRVVAVTAAEAEEAIRLGAQLRQRTRDAGQLPPEKLEREVAALKRVRSHGFRLLPGAPPWSRLLFCSSLSCACSWCPRKCCCQ